MPGISGMALYLPPARVQLADWCAWNEQPWGKISQVVGRSFRMRGPDQSVYTLAANAVWRLLQAYDIDPAQVGYLALGTESSSDNAAGAVIVRGMIDDALAATGAGPLARDCEVPEYKHACLGGVYAIKGALRYLAADGAGRQAIVVCADVAEYALGSSGEPTQGAGAVALLLEAEPQMLHVDLARAGSASAYRLADFRKPFARFRGQAERADGQVQDVPVFNGRYSTNCYVDASCQAMQSMLARSGRDSDWLDEVDAVFMHRPYQRMPQTGWGMVRLAVLAGEQAGRARLEALCKQAGLPAAALISELTRPQDMRARLAAGHGNEDAFATAHDLLRHMRGGPLWQSWVTNQQTLGCEAVCELGNLYTASLPAWLAAGLAQASGAATDITGQQWLALGYGSGDAAEAWPMQVAQDWRAAAAKINFAAALEPAVDLAAQQYVDLHAGRAADLMLPAMADGFVLERTGDGETGYADAGIEYYRYVAAL